MGALDPAGRFQGEPGGRWLAGSCTGGRASCVLPMCLQRVMSWQGTGHHGLGVRPGGGGKADFCDRPFNVRWRVCAREPEVVQPGGSCVRVHGRRMCFPTCWEEGQWSTGLWGAQRSQDRP